MDPMLKAFAALIGATGQAIGVVLFAYWSAPYLDESFPEYAPWLGKSMVIALIVIIYSFYKIINFLLQIERRERESKK